MKRYRLPRGARADLDRIWDYIAERSSAQIASEFIWKFYDTFASIGSSPAAGVSIPELLGDDARRFPMGNYLIYYRSKRGRVEILRVLQGKRLQKTFCVPNPESLARQAQPSALIPAGCAASNKVICKYCCRIYPSSSIPSNR